MIVTTAKVNTTAPTSSCRWPCSRRLAALTGSRLILIIGGLAGSFELVSGAAKREAERDHTLGAVRAEERFLDVGRRATVAVRLHHLDRNAGPGSDSRQERRHPRRAARQIDARNRGVR